MGLLVRCAESRPRAQARCSCSPGLVAACGLDFVIYDMEHGRCDIELLSTMIASCRGSDITAIARVPDLQYAPLSRVLDLGARGVMVPRVETRAQAEDVVAHLRRLDASQSSRIGLAMLSRALREHTYSLRAAEVNVALQKLLANGTIDASQKQHLDWSHSVSPL